MENEPPNVSMQDDGKGTRSRRIMGKLFGRDRKVSQEQGQTQSRDLNDFFHGSSDKLQVAHAGPPMLAKLDVSAATRYPNALQVQDSGAGLQHDLPLHPRSHSQRNPIRKNKGLAVRFADTYPEIIGNGGDECDAPTIEVAKNKRTRPPMVTTATAPPRLADIGSRALLPAQEGPRNDDSFVPKPLQRTQTGYSSVSLDPEDEPVVAKSSTARHIDTQAAPLDDRRRSFIEIHQAQQREAEGLAFAKAVRSNSESQNSVEPGKPSIHPPEPSGGASITESPQSLKAPQIHPPSQSPAALHPPDQPPPPYQQVSPISPNFQTSPQKTSPQPPLRDPRRIQQGHPPVMQYSQRHQPPLPQHTLAQPHDPADRFKATTVSEQSPSSLYSNSTLSQRPGSMRQGSRISERENESPTSTHKSSVHLPDASAAAEEAMGIFVERSRHLFELFRLHSESVRPLRGCLPDELLRAALWWFLTGRMGLENAVRERPSTPESQKRNEFAKQQAHADLAKAYWLSEEIIPEISKIKNIPIDPEVEDGQNMLASTLRKLAMSMKKNGFLPAEEAFLPQAIDRSIWLEYPQITQDITSLLWGSSSSALGQAQPMSSGMSILETLPLGDSESFFSFGRFRTDVYLMEQGLDSQRLFFPCYLSIIRPHKQADIIFVVASQNGSVQLRLSGSKSLGPVWDDVRWRADTCTLDVRLPRGFILVMQCAPTTYKTLRSMYEFSAKVHSSLYPKQDENCIFRTTLRAFQYFDNDPQARQFPKESIPGCEIALFERLLREGAASGPRTYHRGYRIAVVTGPRTKTLSGVNHLYSPQVPVQFGFLRSDANDPALSLKFENGRLKGNMVLSFGDEQERLRMHSLLIGTYLQHDEQIFCEVPLQYAWFSERYGDTYHKGLQVLATLPWQRARVINYDNDGDRPSCVLADRLRIIYDFKDGTVTDRINVAPGELRLRLDVRNPNCIMVYRQSQTDMTVAVTEAKVSRDLPQGLAQALEVLQQAPTIRTLMFPSVADLHAFQSAITGYKVVFDGVACAFAIARRRMVVPIHKKWEAGATRIQVVQQDGATTQLLAFFDDFAHGQCMGFSLKGTDVFESFSRSSKAGLKIVDAKFPLPKVLSPDVDSAQAAADAAFVCLDLPELPGEHDDISILFDNEVGKLLTPVTLSGKNVYG